MYVGVGSRRGVEGVAGVGRRRVVEHIVGVVGVVGVGRC